MNLKTFLVVGLTVCASQSLAESGVEYWDNAIKTQTDQATEANQTATDLRREIEEIKTKRELVREEKKDLKRELQSLQDDLSRIPLSRPPRITLEEANKNVEQAESRHNKAMADLNELLKQEPIGRPGEALDPKTLKPAAKVAYDEANRSVYELRRVQAERDNVQLGIEQKEKAADLRAKIDGKQGELSKMEEADRAVVAELTEKRRQKGEAENRLSELRKDIAKFNGIKDEVVRDEAKKKEQEELAKKQAEEELLGSTPDAQPPEESQTEKTPAQKNDDLKRDLKRHGKGSKEVEGKFKEGAGATQSR